MIEVGGPVDRVTVTLRVFGADLDPSEVTALLGVSPTAAVRKGETSAGSRGPPASQGRWLYEIESEDALDVVVRQLLMRLNGSLDTWKELHTRFSVDLYCGLFAEDWSRGFGLSRETLAALSDRDLSMECDLYFTGEDQSR